MYPKPLTPESHITDLKRGHLDLRDGQAPAFRMLNRKQVETRRRVATMCESATAIEYLMQHAVVSC